MFRFVATKVLLCALLAIAVPAVARDIDPVAADPPVPDAAHPPASAELKIPIGNTRVNGVIYLAQGANPHPLVLLLHGFPGNERNLDLAQALRRAGYNTVYFNYRGSWGSGGSFSFANARADVASVLAWLRSPEVSKKYAIDPARIILLGHSMGGWLALAGAADDAKVGCTVALAPWNIGRFGAMQAGSDHAALDAFLEEARSYTDAEAGPLRGTTAEALAAEAKAHPQDWDFRAFAPALTGKRGLVITSSKDLARSNAMHTTLLTEALRTSNPSAWTFRTYTDDHGFSAHRVQAAHDVIDWIGANCGAPH